MALFCFLSSQFSSQLIKPAFISPFNFDFKARKGIRTKWENDPEFQMKQKSQDNKRNRGGPVHPVSFRTNRSR